MNFSTSACGYVVVQVLDEDGNVRYISDELYGNEIREEIKVGKFEDFKNIVEGGNEVE